MRFPCNKGFTWCFLFLYSLLRLQGKSIRMPMSSPPYDNMTEESAFDNPIYDSGVSTDVMSMQDVDSQNTSVLSWSFPIRMSSHRHLMSHQQRAPSHLSSSCHSSLRASGLSCEIGTFFLTLLWCHISFASWISILSSQRSESAMLELIVVTFTQLFPKSCGAV